MLTSIACARSRTASWEKASIATKVMRPSIQWSEENPGVCSIFELGGGVLVAKVDVGGSGGKGIRLWMLVGDAYYIKINIFL